MKLRTFLEYMGIKCYGIGMGIEIYGIELGRIAENPTSLHHMYSYLLPTELIN